MRALVTRFALFALPLVALAQKPAPAPMPTPIDSTTFAPLQWRNIGPFRGGRANAVAGVTSQPMVFYAGYTGGGVWKTDDAGLTWKNISDGQLRFGSIGAIAVAESDPNVVYVGTGEHAVRGQSSSFGDGVYRSTDAGKTWKHLGLDATLQISAVRVHPTNPDIAWVAAQGNRWTGSPDRGIYRTMDGGKTWSQVLKGENANSGASGLSLDPSNPRILYAAFWDHLRTPWKVRSGGPGSGIWKSTDAGDTWTRLSGGLPKLMGKIDVAVSPANPDRIFAIVEADEGGLFRSDDAGKSWSRQSDDRLIRARAWYYTQITADPQNADVVWVINAPLTRSIDGGKTFAEVRATHGDNHQLWINPRDPKILANANDGGVSVSMNGGKTWSSQDNQPTAQFYRVNVDDAEPYSVYAGQQDNSSVRIKSRSDGFGITVREWNAVSGCESAYLAFNRADPRYVYGGCYHGIIGEYDQQTGFERDIMVWPALGLGEPSDMEKYRFNWNAPIVVSSHDPSVIYHAGNVLFRSRDRGKSWDAISGDLTKNEKATQGQGGGPFTNEGAGGEVYNTIYYVAESPKDANVLWVGTDDGLLHVTRDGGKSWNNITVAAWGPGLVNAIEASPFDPAVAYVAYRKDRLGENAVLAYKTADYGKTWTLITNGLRAGEPVRVVRESPETKGLLYAGTETGAYISFNDGALWTRFSQNLPSVPVTDLIARHGDLIAATEGRAFWIFDDVASVSAMGGRRSTADVELLPVRTATLGRWMNPPFEGVGRNPAMGATLTYQLKAAADSSSPITIDIRNAEGRIIRSYSSQPGAGQPSLPAKAGLNRFVWDLRENAPTKVPGIMAGAQLKGRTVIAGRYTATMTAKGVAGTATSTQTFNVRRDSRAERMSDGDVARVNALLGQLSSRLDDLNNTVNELRDARDQVSKAAEKSKEAPNKAAIDSAAKAIKGSVDALEGELVQPKQKTFQDVINFRNGLADQIMYLQETIENSDSPATRGMETRSEDLDTQWREKRSKADKILDVDIGAFNKLLKDQPQVQVQRKKKTIS